MGYSYCVYYFISDGTDTIQLITFRHQTQDISTFDNYDFYED